MFDNIFIITCKKKKYFSNCVDWAFLKYGDSYGEEWETSIKYASFFNTFEDAKNFIDLNKIVFRQNDIDLKTLKIVKICGKEMWSLKDEMD